MADIAFVYTKARAEFGKKCRFEDEPGGVVSTTAEPAEPIRNRTRAPCVFSFDTTPPMSVHEVRRTFQTPSIENNPTSTPPSFIVVGPSRR